MHTRDMTTTQRTSRPYTVRVRYHSAGTSDVIVARGVAYGSPEAAFAAAAKRLAEDEATDKRSGRRYWWRLDAIVDGPDLGLAGTMLELDGTRRDFFDFAMTTAAAMRRHL